MKMRETEKSLKMALRKEEGIHGKDWWHLIGKQGGQENNGTVFKELKEKKTLVLGKNIKTGVFCPSWLQDNCRLIQCCLQQGPQVLLSNLLPKRLQIG